MYFVRSASGCQLGLSTLLDVPFLASNFVKTLRLSLMALWGFDPRRRLESEVASTTDFVTTNILVCTLLIRMVEGYCALFRTVCSAWLVSKAL